MCNVFADCIKADSKMYQNGSVNLLGSWPQLLHHAIIDLQESRFYYTVEKFERVTVKMCSYLNPKRPYVNQYPFGK